MLSYGTARAKIAHFYFYGLCVCERMWSLSIVLSFRQSVWSIETVHMERGSIHWGSREESFRKLPGTLLSKVAIWLQSQK